MREAPDVGRDAESRRARRQGRQDVDRRRWARARRQREAAIQEPALRQIISEGLDCGPDTKKAKDIYDRLVSRFGSELSVLTDASPSDLGAVAGERVAEGIARVRARDVLIEPDYDGLYSTVKVFPE